MVWERLWGGKFLFGDVVFTNIIPAEYYSSYGFGDNWPLELCYAQFSLSAVAECGKKKHEHPNTLG